jgi:two-component system OmpR family response regulator
MNHDVAAAIAGGERKTRSTGAADADIHVLVIDDDPSIRQLLADYLGEFDIRVSALEDGRDVVTQLESKPIDLLILDVKLPDEDGMQVAHRVRSQWELPIVMLTSRRDEADRVMALELGVDDYLTKPFSPRELLARIRAVLRRTRVRETMADGPAKLRAYRFAGWTLNVRLRKLVSPDGQTIACTNAEFNLLTAFLSAPQRVLSREQLLDLTRLHNDEIYDRSIDTQVARLRRKFQLGSAAKALIRTERGAGYVFTAAVDILR